VVHTRGADGDARRFDARESLDATGRVIAFSSRHPRDIQDEEHDEDLFIRLTKPEE
jgi:hypothetical protein